MPDEILERPGSHEPTTYHKTPKKAALSGWIGSALEYYDFGIYSQAAALIFPTVFFPTGNATVALIASLASYAVGYLTRPLGAVVLGHLGDRHGRKQVLTIAMILMGASTFAVGLLPTYQSVGILAPVLLVVLRLIQGFAVAGELGGASAMIVEHAPFGRRGYFTSFSLQGTQFGGILAAGVFLPLSAVLSDEAFHSWGWRIPFLLSFVVVIAGYLIRRRVDETPAFLEEEAQEEVLRAPIVQVFKYSWRRILLAIGMSMAYVVGTTASVFGAAYATQKGYGIGMSTTTYLWIPVLANVAGVIGIPYYGALSDRIGRRPVMIVGSLSAGLLSFAYLWAISQNNVVLTILLAILMWGVLHQLWNATFATFFQELFPTKTRVTGFAVSQNIGLATAAFLPAIFAAIAPPGTSNVPLIIGGATFALTIVAALCTLAAKETFRVHLNDLGNPDAAPIPRVEYDRLRAAAAA